MLMRKLIAGCCSLVVCLGLGLGCTPPPGSDKGAADKPTVDKPADEKTAPADKGAAAQTPPTTEKAPKPASAKKAPADEKKADKAPAK